MQEKISRLEKIVISSGLGTFTVSEIENLKEHFEKIMASVLNTKKPAKVVFTTCKKSNALFKIRKGKTLG